MKEMSTRIGYIYVLVDPRTPDVYHYVGQTIHLRKRLGEHIRKARAKHCRAHVGNWINKIVEEGYPPAIICLESVSVDMLDAAEEKLISIFRNKGYPLKNLRDGGKVNKIRNPTNDVRLLISRALKGRQVSAETRARLSKAKTGTRISAEIRATMNKWRIGQPLTPEHRENIRKANKGKKLSEEHKTRISQTRQRKKEQQTHCKHGHEWNKENAYINHNNVRSCRRCACESRRKNRRKNTLMETR